MENSKVLAIAVAVLVAGLLLGNFITGMATIRKINGGGGDISCTDYDNDRYFGQNNCGTLRDCNDNNPYVYPGAEEICGNSIDDDCSNGDIGLCDASIITKTSKDSYLATEEVLLK